jgi:hypothetical protein
MLRRVNAALFEAPAGARIQVVAESRNNDGVNDARFEYAGNILPREIIQGLPGCTFDVDAATAQLQAVVAFADTAPWTARYDLAEIENGVKLNLGKFTMKLDGAPLISFAIEPVAAAARPPMTRSAPGAARKRAGRKKKAAKRKRPAAKRKRPAAKRKATKKKGSKKKIATKSRRGSSRKRR